MDTEKTNVTKTLILVGAGLRGMGYTHIANLMEGRFKVVAVAEPIPERRAYVQQKHGIPDEYCFDTWEKLLALPKIADAALVCTMDRDHFAPSMAAIEKGYDLLVEKPVSPSLEECETLDRRAKELGRSVLVCHVLRYTPFFNALKKIIDDGTIGDVMHVQHMECVGNVHQSHSFVRGNWHRSDETSPMLLQKCCHDMDILQWMLGKKCLRVHSFGSLTHFRPENAPEGAPEYCIDGCPKGSTCPYNAVKLYLDDKNNGWFRGASTRLPEPTDEDVVRVLRTTNYGRCAYKCDNNVVDHQTADLEFEGGTTVSFSMCAFGKSARTIRVMGTKGDLHAEMGNPNITIYDFETSSYRTLSIDDMILDETIVGGHGGGDTGLMYTFYDMLTLPDGAKYSNLSESVESHKIVFAAEKSRLEGRVVDVE